jgi:hypothetical protein
VKPGAQVHWALTQRAPKSQAVPQAPQLAALVLRSTHVETIPPPGPAAVHSVRPPAPQPATHAPFWQVVPARHTVPQAPQLASSLAVLVQVVPQRVSPGPH